jgi:hypothetical protein
MFRPGVPPPAVFSDDRHAPRVTRPLATVTKLTRFTVVREWPDGLGVCPSSVPVKSCAASKCSESVGMRPYHPKLICSRCPPVVLASWRRAHEAVTPVTFSRFVNER